MATDAEALAKLAEELKCPLCIDILKPPCARPACCHYLCSSCLTDLLKNRQECPICKGPLRRRDIRGDAQRLAPEELVEYQPLQPADQNAPRRHSSGVEPKRASRSGRSRRSAGSGAQPPDAGPADAGADHGADGSGRGQSAAAARPAKRARASNIKQEAATTDAAAANGRLFETAATVSEAGPAEALLTFKRPKRRQAAKAEPEHGQAPEQQPQGRRPQPPQQQAADTQRPAEQPEQSQQVKRAQAAVQSAKQQLQEAARRHRGGNGKCGDGRRVPEPEVDPYAFHSSGSQPSAPQAVLVAAPTAAGATAAAASSPSAAAPPARPLVGHPTARDASRAAKRGRTAAPDPPATAADAAGGGSQDAGQASGRRIPGRLVPWACSACTFENPANAHECTMCTAPRPKQRSPSPLEAQPSQQTGGAAAAAPGSGSAARRPAKRRGAQPAEDADVTGAAAPAAMPSALAGPSGSRRPAAAAKPGAGLVLVPSGMDAAGKEQLAAFARAVGARLAPRNKWSDAVTHVICGVAAPDGAPKRTLTVLLGVLTGRWVVSASWLPPPGSTCVANEADHEIVGGPQLGRLNRNAGGEPLLSGYEIHLAGHFGRKEDFTRLIRASGAKLLARPPPSDGPTAKRLTEAVCLYDEDSCSWGKGERQRGRVWHVSSKWLSDTAYAYIVAPLEEYIVEPG